MSGADRVSHPLLRHQLGEPQVQHFRLPPHGDEDVGRLDVAVDDSFGVRRLERVRDLDARRQQLLELHGPALDPVLQGAPFQQFHGDEVLPILLVDFVDGADIGMVQSGSGAGFPLKTLDRLPVTRVLRRQELQRHAAAELRVFRAVDDTHASAAELFQDAIVGDASTRGWRGHSDGW